MPAASSAVHLLVRAAEQHRVAALEAHDHFVMRGGVDQALVDEALRGGVAAAALADRDLLGARGERERVRMHERVVEDDVGPLEQPRGAQRQQVGGAGTGADQIDLSHAMLRPRGTPSAARRRSAAASTSVGAAVPVDAIAGAQDVVAVARAHRNDRHGRMAGMRDGEVDLSAHGLERLVLVAGEVHLVHRDHDLRRSIERLEQRGARVGIEPAYGIDDHDGGRWRGSRAATAVRRAVPRSTTCPRADRRRCDTGARCAPVRQGQPLPASVVAVRRRKSGEGWSTAAW